jgi:hypothetical protein
MMAAERIRGAYVALLPVDPEARRAELEALKRELHLDDLDPTPGTKRRRTKKANPLSLQEHIARQSAEAAKNKGPMDPLARPSWSPRLPQSEEKLEPHNRPRWCGSVTGLSPSQDRTWSLPRRSH